MCDICLTNLHGEPTENELLIGSKGLLEVELNFKGVKVHSSNPSKGKSANLNAVKFIADMDKFYNEEIKVFEEKSYDVPYTTMNVGIINGGSAKNSVSANCNVVMDFRIAEKNHIDIIKKKLEELANIYECDIDIIESIEPFINKLDFIKDGNTANFITEASFIKESEKIILGTGPVTAHEVNEFITEESFKYLVEQYKKLVLKICETNI